mmetsp:Transcript_35191/g.75099  ORF Transcript_35191/g.75099 Transcript_35191/m.75099 type:complete len:219 (+) Transcript_35191:1755-2411(+)
MYHLQTGANHGNLLVKLRLLLRRQRIRQALLVAQVLVRSSIRPLLGRPSLLQCRLPAPAQSQNQAQLVVQYKRTPLPQFSVVHSSVAVIKELYSLSQRREAERRGKYGHVDGIEQLSEGGHREVLFLLLIHLGTERSRRLVVGVAKGAGGLIVGVAEGAGGLVLGVRREGVHEGASVGPGRSSLRGNRIFSILRNRIKIGLPSSLVVPALMGLSRRPP